MSGDIIIGGGFFTHDRMKFVHLINKDKEFKVKKLEKNDILKPSYKISGDYVVLLGIKGIARFLRKSKIKTSQIKGRMRDFLSKVIPSNIPLVVVDDWSLDLLKEYGKEMRDFFFQNFNVKAYLLREYLKNTKYQSNVFPFSLPCDNFTNLFVSTADKKLDIFFQGNNSHKDRKSVLSEIKKSTQAYRCHYKIMHGGTKNVKDRMPFKDFLKAMSNSHIGLSFSGSGYDCYRYHEISSVGSIIATPDYPLVIRNDYKDMKSKIVYSSPAEFVKKVNIILKSRNLLEEMQKESMSVFLKHHTSQVRYNELKEFIGRIK